MKFFATAAALIAVSSALFASPVNADCCRPKDLETTTKLDFYESTVVTNELHVDDGEIRYNNVGIFEDKTLDLVVTITSGDYTDITDAWDRKNTTWPSNNGKNNKFGVINLQTVRNKPNSGRGNFRFCLVKEGTDIPVTLETFSFTVYDADERGDDDLLGGIGIKERLFLDTSQVSSYQLVDGSEIVTSCEDGSSVLPCPTGVRTMFHSSTAGTGPDNPSDPNILDDLQKKRSIGFNFEDTSCWEFTYDHYCPADQPGYDGDENKCRWYGGGNFLFAGTSDVIVNEGKCNPTPTPAPTYPPTASPSGSPTDRPTYPPTATPSGSPTDRPTYPPTASPSASPSDRPTYPPTPSPSGSPTNRPTYPPTVSPSDRPTYPLTDPPTFPPTPSPRDDTCECDAGDDIGSFKCSNYIYVCPGVTEVCETSRNSDYYPITQDECDAMKELDINDPCPALERFGVPSRDLSHRVCYSTTDGITTGFKVDVVCCDTCEPDPVDFSAPPTGAPSEGHIPNPPVPSPVPVCPIPDPDPVPETCPEDVTVIQQIGVTAIEGVDAVDIISQDTNFVTVSLKNAWTDYLDLSVDQIYYQYKKDYLDEDCYPALQVPGTCNYAQITIQCYAHKPFAELDICVADNGGALQNGDDATIPKCCHAEVPDNTPTVCYKLVINCETECVDSVERRALRGASQLGY